ncbi:MAG TPA: methyltransferase [Microthrixaceae bacterium]|nr:methyltransferase [Microthrixaceae bacterium]
MEPPQRPPRGSGHVPGHYYDEAPTVASRTGTVRLTLPDLTVDLTTDRGVFSADAIDAGTKYLLTDAPHPPGTGVLVDLGCGYGPIAISLARRSPAATVWAVDVNERARDLCRANAAANGCDNVIVVAPAEVPEALVVDGIWSNPPIRVGKAALHEMLTSWLGRLAPTGSAWLVVQRHLGADSLVRWLDDHGHPTRRLGSRQGYRILEASPRA